MIIKGPAYETLPVCGDGMNVRDWLYVEDHANALALVLERGVDEREISLRANAEAPGVMVGETYNVGGRNERANLHVVHTICDLLDTMNPRPGAIGRLRHRPARP
jgi:dTDP-glucose 4,6-dehydratase